MSAPNTDEHWFILPMQSWPEESRRTVLAGKPIGANRLVKVFDTPEEAETAVREHNAALHENGPASAPTLPDRGSNNPCKENAVNEQQHRTIAPDAPAMPDFVRAFDELEHPIDVLVRRVKSLDYLIGMLMEHEADEFGNRRIGTGFFETIASTTWDAYSAGQALEKQWTDIHNTRCEAELAEFAADPKKATQALRGVRVPLMGGVR